MSIDRTKLTPAAGGVAYNPGDPFHMPNQGDFGPRTRDYHVGIDYGAKAGTPIPAASSGEVIYSGPAGGFHYAVMVKSVGQDGKAYYSVYGHVDPEDALAAGTRVSAGQTIGNVGIVHRREKSDGPHEHFGIVTEEALARRGIKVPAPGGLGFSTGMTDLFENPDKFTNWADGAPYNARTYIPIRDGLAPRPISYLTQSQEANRLVSEGNPVSHSGVSPQMNRFYDDTGGHAPDQLASIANASQRVVTPEGSAGGPAATGFPRGGSPAPNLYLDATQTAQRLHGNVPPSGTPFFPMQTIPGDAENSSAPQSAPNSLPPQGGKRSAAFDSLLATAFGATGASDAQRSLFSQLMSAGPDPVLVADSAVSPPLQPDEEYKANVDPTRFLVGRRYDPSQRPPFAARPAPPQPSPDGSLSLNDAYLEYLKRLNAI